MLADVPLVPRLPLCHASYVRAGHSDIRILLVDIRVAVVAIVVLLPPHVAAGTSQEVQGGAKDRAHVLVVAHGSVIRVVLNGHADQRHAAAPRDGE